MGIKEAIVFDCEFLTSAGAPSRFWCGPDDPDPTVVQIGAVKLDLQDPFGEIAVFERIFLPVDRQGEAVPIDPFFTELTGLEPEHVARTGVPLPDALRDLARFARDLTLWSWGKDELNLMAISCYIAGITPPIPAARFGNACRLFLRAGVPLEDVERLRSSTLPAHFGLPPRPSHDALEDARAVTDALRHLMVQGLLGPADFELVSHRA